MIAQTVATIMGTVLKIIPNMLMTNTIHAITIIQKIVLHPVQMIQLREL